MINKVLEGLKNRPFKVLTMHRCENPMLKPKWLPIASFETLGEAINYIKNEFYASSLGYSEEDGTTIYGGMLGSRYKIIDNSMVMDKKPVKGKTNDKTKTEPKTKEKPNKSKGKGENKSETVDTKPEETDLTSDVNNKEENTETETK